MTQRELMELVNAAFADVARPTSFTGAAEVPWDSEIQKHELTMASRDRATLSVEDMGWGGRSPMPFLTPEAFRYYMPTFVRLALSPQGDGFLAYLVELLSTPIDLRDPPRSLHETGLFDRRQVEATLRFLEHVADTQRQALDDHGVSSPVLPRAIRNWQHFLSCFDTEQ